MSYNIGDTVRLKKTLLIKRKMRGRKVKIIEVRRNSYIAEFQNKLYSIWKVMIAYKLKRG